MVSGRWPLAADSTSFKETEPPKTNQGDKMSGRKRCRSPAKQRPSSRMLSPSFKQHASSPRHIRAVRYLYKGFKAYISLKGFVGLISKRC